jgi:hypothetical protein
MMQKKPGREGFSTTQVYLKEELGKKGLLHGTF